MNKVYWGTGRRKTSVARVQATNGTGKVTLNDKSVTLENSVSTPLVLVGKAKDLDLSIKVKGGGFNSQKEAIRHGIANVLIDIDETLRPTLRKAGFLTRDDRMKERKKYGLKKARRAPQWSKR